MEQPHDGSGLSASVLALVWAIMTMQLTVIHVSTVIITIPTL